MLFYSSGESVEPELGGARERDVRKALFSMISAIRAQAGYPAADGMRELLHRGGGDAVASTRPDGRSRPADAVSVGAGGPVPVLDNRHSISSAGLFNVKEIHVMTDGRVLINPRTGEIVEAVLASRRIFKADKYAEPRGITQKSKSKNVENSVDGRGAARAKRRVFELAACNDFSLFFTLTLNPEKIDRYDYKAAVKRFGVWASNRVQRHGLRYVAVPELHQDGAVHFHGLCAGDDTLLRESPVKWKGKQVYNLDWDIGYSTAVKLTGDTLRAARYVAKYVTKQTGGGTIGGRYFFHGGPLVGFHVQHFQGAGAPLTGHRVEVPDAGLALLYIDLKDPRNVEILGDLVQNRKGGVKACCLTTTEIHGCFAARISGRLWGKSTVMGPSCLGPPVWWPIR